MAYNAKLTPISGAPRAPSPIVRIKRPSERRSRSGSATRALDLLEYFGEIRRPLRAVEIARMLGIKPSSADQLLKTMVDSAHLVFDAGSKTYLPSIRLIGISRWIIESYGADEALHLLVRDIQQRTGMTVTLTVPNDLFMQIVDLVTPVGIQTERGLRISVFGSAIGSAYLASLDPESFSRLANRGRVPIAELPHLTAGIAAIRAQGFADGDTTGAMWSIAVPLPEQNLGVPMVLGLAGPADLVRPQRDRLAAMMCQAVAGWAAAHPYTKAASNISVPAQESFSASGS